MGLTKIIYVMGVSGSGKSTIGRLLAKKLGYPFFDGDDYHPSSNIEKMSKGIPLNDNDRQEWLITLNSLAKEHRNTGAVIVCSALKASYRDTLKKGLENLCIFVYLKGSLDEIKDRLQLRKGHFMPIHLLQSQFDTLEEPKDAITLSITETPQEIVAKAIKYLDE